MNKIKIFIGASSEASNEKLQVLKILEKFPTVQPISWEEIFTAGEFGLESLLRIKNHVDAAILIATHDDKSWYRGTEGFTPRDNILFELGMFMGSLGRLKVGLIVVKDVNENSPRIPTDLNGYNYIGFTEGKNATNEDQLNKWLLKLQNNFDLKRKEFKLPFDPLIEEYPFLPESWKDEIQNYIFYPYDRLSRNAIRGEFTLNIPQYYNSLFSSINNAKEESIVRAVSVLSEQFWEDDPFQQQYINLNIQATKRGVKIKRLFVTNRGIHSGLWKIIQKQLDNQIEVRVINSRIFSRFIHLDDVVIIQDKFDMRSYTSNQILDASNRLKSANLNLNINSCQDKINEFDSVWSMAELPKPSMVQIKQAISEPIGLTLETFNLEKDVITCQEAALARNVPLKNELKTMILSTSDGFIAVHIPGDGTISLRAIKNVLEVKNAYVAPPEELYKLELSPGTVSAVLNPVWDMPNLISKRVLTQDFVTTNNGTRRQYFKFDPIRLLESSKHLVGQFEK